MSIFMVLMCFSAAALLHPVIPAHGVFILTRSRHKREETTFWEGKKNGGGILHRCSSISCANISIHLIPYCALHAGNVSLSVLRISHSHHFILQITCSFSQILLRGALC